MRQHETSRNTTDVFPHIHPHNSHTRVAEHTRSCARVTRCYPIHGNAFAPLGITQLAQAARDVGTLGRQAILSASKKDAYASQNPVPLVRLSPIRLHAAGISRHSRRVKEVPARTLTTVNSRQRSTSGAPHQRRRWRSVKADLPFQSQVKARSLLDVALSFDYATILEEEKQDVLRNNIRSSHVFYADIILCVSIDSGLVKISEGQSLTETVLS